MRLITSLILVSVLFAFEMAHAQNTNPPAKFLVAWLAFPAKMLRP